MEGASARHFAIAFRLALGGLIGCALLQLLLYARPGPYGGAFLLEWRRYFALALYYDMMGVWLIALPFFLYWLARWRRAAPKRARARHLALALLMAANLLLSAIDHELLRFLGVRLGLSFLLTYARAGTLSDSLFADVLAGDEGGAFLAVLLPILAPALYLWWALRTLRRLPDGARPLPLGLWLALPLAIVPLAAPANAWQMATGKFRLRKVEPVIVAMAVDAVQGFGDLGGPADFALLVRDHQARWLAESADKAWRFPDPERPYLRVPAEPSAGPTSAGTSSTSSSRRSGESTWAFSARRARRLRLPRSTGWRRAPTPRSGAARSASAIRASTGCSRCIARSRRTAGATSPPSPRPASIACPSPSAATATAPKCTMRATPTGTTAPTG